MWLIEKDKLFNKLSVIEKSWAGTIQIPFFKRSKIHILSKKIAVLNWKLRLRRRWQGLPEIPRFQQFESFHFSSAYCFSLFPISSIRKRTKPLVTPKIIFGYLLLHFLLLSKFLYLLFSCAFSYLPKFSANSSYIAPKWVSTLSFTWVEVILSGQDIQKWISFSLILNRPTWQTYFRRNLFEPFYF